MPETKTTQTTERKTEDKTLKFERTSISADATVHDETHSRRMPRMKKSYFSKITLKELYFK